MYCARAAAIRDGSSPHTRGTPLGSHCWRSNPRFIPAYAGNAKSLAPHSSPHSVHPRIRGERGAGLSGRGGRCGSSPHTRGTQDGRLSSLMENRFIPAYAGNAESGAQLPISAAVHPRIRGERRAHERAAPWRFGSSPHTRGTRGQHHSASDGLRFIPAYAGNALGRIDQPEDGPVHPRIRGERHLELNMNNIELGSSPHTRGTRIDADRYRPNTRFIPAYAGNAPRMPRRPTRSPVHPRIRGERKTSDLCKQHPDGSSPHTRGTLHRNVRNLVGRRFIPAYAGNASSACGQRSCSPVHPRIRGEREVLKKRVLVIDGSSPHTRGTRPAASAYRA